MIGRELIDRILDMAKKIPELENTSTVEITINEKGEIRMGVGSNNHECCIASGPYFTLLNAASSLLNLLEIEIELTKDAR